MSGSNTEENFSTDYRRFSAARIKSVYLQTARLPGRLRRLFKINLHASLVFETDEGRVLTFCGLPNNEVHPAHFLRILAGTFRKALRQGFRAAAWETAWDFGPIRAALYENAPMNYPADIRHPVGKPGQKVKRDRANYLRVRQGQGLMGLEPFPNLCFKLIATGSEAQKILNAALDINRQLDRAAFTYNLIPSANGNTGLNSISVCELALLQADQMGANHGQKTNYGGAFKSLGHFIGLSTNKRLRGPGLATVTELARRKHEEDPQAGRWLPNNGRKPIPAGWLIQYG